MVSLSLSDFQMHSPCLEKTLVNFSTLGRFILGSDSLEVKGNGQTPYILFPVITSTSPLWRSADVSHRYSS